MTSSRSTRYLDLLSRAVAHVDAHLDQPLDANTLTDAAAMSRHHFHRVFRAHFGTTVNGYVTWRRLHRACELLADPRLGVLDVALAVGYESAQALAKAMRREIDTTPSALRAGAAPAWQRMFDRRPDPSPAEERPSLSPQMIDMPALPVLTATGRGMTAGNLTAASQQAFGELLPFVESQGLMPLALSCMGILPDEPQGPDDPHCRMVTGFVFGHSRPERCGTPTVPDQLLPLTGSLAWWHLPAGRHAVFTHVGGYDTLHVPWREIYRDWLPATGYALRDATPFELYVDDGRITPPERLRTECWLPIV